MRSGQPGPMIIDFHTHIMPPEFSAERRRYRSLDATLRELFADDQGGMATGSQLVKQMDKAGIDVSVAVGYGGPTLEWRARRTTTSSMRPAITRGG